MATEAPAPPRLQHKESLKFNSVVRIALQVIPEAARVSKPQCQGGVSPPILSIYQEVLGVVLIL